MSGAFLRRMLMVLGALIVVWLGLSVIRSSNKDTAGKFTPTKLDKNSVESIVIARPTDTVTLTKQGGSWLVNGFPTTAGSVDELLKALADSSAEGEVVAESAKSHANLGIDSAGARKVTANQGGKALLTYLVGKRGANWESAFVRRPGENTVYQVRGRLVEYIERKPEDWRDKRIVEVSADSLTSVELHRGKQTYTLVKKDKAWTLSGGPADSGAVARLLGQLTKIEAAGFASKAQEDSAKFDQPERLVRLIGAGGKPLATLAFDSTNNGFWVKRDAVPVVYRLDPWTVNQMIPADSTLKKK